MCNTLASRKFLLVGGLKDKLPKRETSRGPKTVGPRAERVVSGAEEKMGF